MPKSTIEIWEQTVMREREYIAKHPHIEDIPGAQELLDEALELIDVDTRPEEYLPRGSMSNQQIVQLALAAISEIEGTRKRELLANLRRAVENRKHPPEVDPNLKLSYPDDDIFEDLDIHLPEGRHSRPARTSDDTSRGLQAYFES